MNQRVKHALQILGVWTIPAVVGQTGWAVAGGERSLDAIGWGLLYQAAYWYPWSLLTPLILRLADRYSILTGQTSSVLLRHLGFSVGFALMHQTLHIIPYTILEGHAFFSDEFWSGAQFFFLFTTNVSMVTYFGIAAFSWWRQYAQRAKSEAVRAARLEGEIAQLRLQMLRGQLQPHFLFNSLNTIAGLIHDSPDAADRMVSKLSRLLRSSLTESEHTVIPLERELDMLQTYCDIQQERFGDKVTFTFDVPKSLHHCAVPPFILQPLVENAVHHGLTDGAQRVDVLIHAVANSERLTVKVTDSGSGLPSNWKGESDFGVGLTNTSRRLRYLYNGDASLEISRNPGGGVTSTITLPPRPRRQLEEHHEESSK